jgi:6-pyruvoyl-tetrahydropterin synthase
MKKIKYLLFAMLFIGIPIGQIAAQSAGLIKILDGIEEKDGVTSILITKKMFELFTKTTDLDVKGESLNEVIGSLDKLMIYDVNLSTAENNTIAKNITNMLKQDGYEVLMKVNEPNSKVEIYIQEQNNKVKHLFLISKEQDAVQLISLLGNIDLAKISKLAGTLNIKELELIDKK